MHIWMTAKQWLQGHREGKKCQASLGLQPTHLNDYIVQSLCERANLDFAVKMAISGLCHAFIFFHLHFSEFHLTSDYLINFSLNYILLVFYFIWPFYVSAVINPQGLGSNWRIAYICMHYNSLRRIQLSSRWDWQSGHLRKENQSGSCAGGRGDPMGARSLICALEGPR